MIKKFFNDISIRGRIAFCIMSVERYTRYTYPGLDYFSSTSRRFMIASFSLSDIVFVSTHAR